MALVMFAALISAGPAPAQAAEQGAVSSVAPAAAAPAVAVTNTLALRDSAMMSKAADEQGITVAPNVVPDAYRVCAPNKCVWVEKTRYCPPDTGCGGRAILRPWPGGYCSSSTGCATLNGQNYQVYAPNVYDNGEVGKVARCAAALGLNAASYWTKGFSKLALAGTGLATWGCSAI